MLNFAFGTLRNAARTVLYRDMNVTVTSQQRQFCPFCDGRSVSG